MNKKIIFFYEFLPQHLTKGSPVFFGGHEQVAVPLSLEQVAAIPHFLTIQGSFFILNIIWFYRLFSNFFSNKNYFRLIEFNLILNNLINFIHCYL